MQQIKYFGDIMNRKIPIGLTKYFWVALVSIPLLGMSSFAKPYSNEELAEKSATCLDCHDSSIVSLKGSTHQIGSQGQPMRGTAIGCISCHEGWEKHLDEPSAETISIPSALSSQDQARICGQCHLDPHQAGMVSSDPHIRAGVACLSCHGVHGNPNRKLLKEDGENFCLTCHTTIADEFKRRFVHPLESGNISCLDCHPIAGMKDPSLARGIDWTCQNCHSEKSGPFIHEHPVTNNYLVNGGGCVECHEPHGSPNDRLLKQPGNGVCIQCHAVPPAHRSRHGGWGIKDDCVFCHTDIHGSNENKKFLDPNLTSKFVADCYQAGCHTPEN